MRYRLISGRELLPDMVTRWQELQRGEPAMASPYFHPEFTRCVAAVRNDVRIGIMEDNKRIMGFFPFQLKKGGIARPIGLGLSDYHGVIADPQAQWSASELMRGCKLIRWEFDHLPTSLSQFSQYHSTLTDSPIIELSQGFETFVASRDKSSRKLFREIQRKQEKLTANVGPVKFTLHSPDPANLEQLMAWKSEQCHRTGTVDFFAQAWCRQLIERIHATRTTDFGGLLSCLHVGDKLAAIHFSMYSSNVWHSWFPAYNNDLEEYSPGLILLFHIIKAAAAHDIKYIDLGKGISLYKKRVMTGSITVAEGTLTTPSINNKLLGLRKKTEEWSKQSFLRPLLRVPGRIIKDLERKKRYE